MPPTIVLVHGAVAETSSWNRVLPADHRVIAAPTVWKDVPSWFPIGTEA